MYLHKFYLHDFYLLKEETQQQKKFYTTQNINKSVTIYTVMFN
jgi:hypothetical protein